MIDHKELLALVRITLDSNIDDKNKVTIIVNTINNAYENELKI